MVGREIKLSAQEINDELHRILSSKVFATAHRSPGLFAVCSGEVGDGFAAPTEGAGNSDARLRAN